MSTARKRSLIRVIEDATCFKVLEVAQVPVRIVAEDSV